MIKTGTHGLLMGAMNELNVNLQHTILTLAGDGGFELRGLCGELAEYAAHGMGGLQNHY